MPTAYTIDPDRQLVRATAWGRLTEAETRALCNALRDDPAFVPTYRQMCDLREVTEIEASTIFLRHLACHSIFLSDTRRAWVARSDIVFGLARMLQVFCDNEGREVGVFRTLAEGNDWLGLTDVPCTGLADSAAQNAA